MSAPVALEAMRMARIRTDDGKVFIVENLREVAGLLKFDSASRSVRALNRPDFQTSVRAIPVKRIVDIEEFGVGQGVTAS